MAATPKDKTAKGTRTAPAEPELPGADTAVSSEEAQAQRAASRLGIPHVDLGDFPINHDLFRQIPVDLMFRYNFVPWKEEDGRLVVVISDPSDVLMVDELEILLARDRRLVGGLGGRPGDDGGRRRRLRLRLRGPGLGRFLRFGRRHRASLSRSTARTSAEAAGRSPA